MRSRENDEIEARACEWLIRIRDLEYDACDPIPDPCKRFESFLVWISQSTRHLDAARGAAQISRGLRSIDPHRRIDLQALLVRRSENPAVLASDSSAPSTFHTPARRPWSVCATLLTLVLVPLLFQSVGSWPLSYDSAIGQQVWVRLEDHSTVELNTGTHIHVRYGPHSREVTLLSGEALFDVRHDPHRPFRVLSGSTVIEDVGTKFDVYLHSDDTTTITVVTGRVLVSSTTGREGLDGGQTATVGGPNTHVPFRAINLSSREIKRRLSWQLGKLTFEGETLAEAVAEFNRYNERRLVIQDPVIANMRLGGTFRAHDLDGFIEALETLFNVRATPMPGSSKVIELQRR